MRLGYEDLRLTRNDEPLYHSWSARRYHDAIDLIVYNFLQSGDNVDDRERGSFLYDTSRLTRSAVFVPICDEMPVPVCSSLLAYFP